ncbi:MAG TPA: TetR/AcrR family transcriptional regulator [Pseudonocardia sp.]|nr:TetR/AcrR family transcriptional regulator [Pseudonocardia sp.]
MADRQNVPKTKRRLTAADWTAAALDALAAGGLTAVAVEPLATRLGTTKGSFYWHFSGRDALLAAALEHWERIDTEDVITLVAAEPDAGRRLHALLAGAIGGWPHRIGSVELALLPSAGHPLVAPVLARATRRRLDYLTDQFSELGFDRDAAGRRALLAYTAYLGHAHLAHATPELTPPRADLPGYVQEVIAVLTSR